MDGYHPVGSNVCVDRRRQARGQCDDGCQLRAMGYPHWFLYAVGFVEIAGALLLLLPRLAFWGAALMAGNMAGALLTHATHDEWSLGSFALVMMGLVSFVGWVRRPEWLRGEALRGVVS